jgi:hypothetical protein
MHGLEWQLVDVWLCGAGDDGVEQPVPVISAVTAGTSVSDPSNPQAFNDHSLLAPEVTAALVGSLASHWLIMGSPDAPQPFTPAHTGSEEESASQVCHIRAERVAYKADMHVHPSFVAPIGHHVTIY